jgi:hypothetical protein
MAEGVVGVAMAQRKGWVGERRAEIDRSPVQTTCWSKMEERAREGWRCMTRQRETASLVVVFLH